MQGTANPESVNPTELEARALELEAEALFLRARARRLTLEPKSPAPSTPEHMNCTEYARSRGVSGATVGRWIAEGMPHLPVGSTVRIVAEEADAWRRARGRKPTKSRSGTTDELAVDDIASKAGLRTIVGGRAK